MQESKTTITYRIILSLSFAVFVHVLVATLLGGWFPEPSEPQPKSIKVRVAPQGNAPAETAASQQSKAGSEPRSPATESGGAQPLVGRDTGTASSPIEAPPNTRTPDRPNLSAATPDAGQERSLSSLQRLFGQTSPDPETAQEARISRISRNDRAELSEYELKLWEKIARQIRYEAFMGDQTREMSVELELQLLDNGALRRARIKRSSGSDELDALGRQAALSASPYPRPPDGGGRFQVRLIFEPPIN